MKILFLVICLTVVSFSSRDALSIDHRFRLESRKMQQLLELANKVHDETQQRMTFQAQELLRDLSIASETENSREWMYSRLVTVLDMQWRHVRENFLEHPRYFCSSIYPAFVSSVSSINVMGLRWSKESQRNIQPIVASFNEHFGVVRRFCLKRAEGVYPIPTLHETHRALFLMKDDFASLQGAISALTTEYEVLRSELFYFMGGVIYSESDDDVEPSVPQTTRVSL